MDHGSNAADPWFDWSQLDKAEVLAVSVEVVQKSGEDAEDRRTLSPDILRRR